MKRPIFKSSFNGLINKYLDYRANQGIHPGRDHTYLQKLDAFLEGMKCEEGVFPRSLVPRWRTKRESETDNSHYLRVGVSRRFFEYLHSFGYDVALFRDVKPPKANYVPHIYSDDEIQRYFEVVDTHPLTSLDKDRYQLPVFFRILYCCGTRVTETLQITKKDVDITNGIIRLRITKGDKERYVVMSDGLKELMAVYASKVFFFLNDDSPIFSNKFGLPYTEPSIHVIHRKILGLAGIPIASSSGKNKRIHDWRHTFAVKSFKKLVDDGVDLYASLPILSAYLGHRNIHATEYYIRLTSSLYPYVEEKLSAVMKSIIKSEET